MQFVRLTAGFYQAGLRKHSCVNGTYCIIVYNVFEKPDIISFFIKELAVNSSSRPFGIKLKIIYYTAFSVIRAVGGINAVDVSDFL